MAFQEGYRVLSTLPSGAAHFTSVRSPRSVSQALGADTIQWCLDVYTSMNWDCAQEGNR